MPRFRVKELKKKHRRSQGVAERIADFGSSVGLGEIFW
jgi:hypothetical protein